MRQFFTTLAAFAVLAVPAAQAENKSLGVHAKDFYAFATSEKQKNGAVFGTLKNVSREDVAITQVSGDVAENIELHTMSSKMGIMKMREVDAIFVPKRQVVQLNPQGNHIMLMGLKRQLNVGDTLYLKIANDDGVGISIPVQVREAGDVPEGAKAGMQAMEDTKQKKAEPAPEPKAAKEEKPAEQDATREEEVSAAEAAESERAKDAVVSTPDAAEAVEDAAEEAAESVKETVSEAAEAVEEAVEEVVEPSAEKAPQAAQEEKPAKKSLWEKLKW